MSRLSTFTDKFGTVTYWYGDTQLPEDDFKELEVHMERAYNNVAQRNELAVAAEKGFRAGYDEASGKLAQDIEDLKFHLKNAKLQYDPKLSQSIGFLGLCIMQASMLPRVSNADELMSGAKQAFRDMFMEEE